MAIKIELFKTEFVKLFTEYDREANFTVCAREALFDYFEELSDAIGQDINADIVAICCEWTEYNKEELVRGYGQYLPEEPSYYYDEEELHDALIAALRDETQVIELNNGNVLVQEF